MKVSFNALDVNNLPEIGELVLVNIRAIGVRKVVLVNDPDQKRGFFNLFPPKQGWFCPKEECFYSFEMVQSWARIGNVVNPVVIGCFK